MEEPRWPAASSRYWQAFNCPGSHWFALWVQTRVPVGLRSSAPALFCWPLQFCWLRQTQECLWTSNWAHRSLSFSTIKQNTDTDTKTHTHTHTHTHTPRLSLNGMGDEAIKHCTIRIHIRNEDFLLGMGYLCVCVCVCVCVTVALVDCLSAPPPSLWHPNEGIISTSHGTWNRCNLAFINVFAG